MSTPPTTQYYHYLKHHKADQPVEPKSQGEPTAWHTGLANIITAKQPTLKAKGVISLEAEEKKS